MDLLELLLRIHTLGEEPPAGKSISYHTDDSKLFDALRQALHSSEYDELKESKLGVFIKFKELNFGWASRLVHYMLGFHLDIKKKYELWSLVVPQPVRFSLLEFEYLTGVAYYALPEFGASYGNSIPNRQSPVLLAYKGGKRRRSFKEAISRHTSMINFVQKDFGEMFPRWDFDAEDSAPENIIKVMFNAKPRWKWTMDCWKVTCTKPSVKKEVSTAETESGVKEESGRPRKKASKEKSTEARAKASKGPPTERDIAGAMRDGFGMFLKEIKLLGDRMEAVEKKVRITKKGTASNDLQITGSSPPKRGHEPGSESVNGAKAGQNDAQEPSSSKELSLVIAKEPEVKPPEQSGEPSVLVLDKGASTISDVQQGEAKRQTKNAKAMEYVHGKSERERKLAASQPSPFKLNNTAKLIIPNKRVGQGYDPFAPIDKKMSKVLTDWVKLDS
uniref:DUF1985 domain-containing protein n=1 Tax=Brassica oleracea var. oleracea TaxID=109376 RepID=A0A0D3BZZ1_BRAOL